MRSSDELEQGLVADQSQPVVENRTPAYVYIITKLFPLLATGVFASTTDVKKPESIALSAAMVSSTALPVISDALKLSGRFQLSLETLSGLFMFAGVGMMDQGAVADNNKSLRSIIALTAVGCFSLFAAVNVAYSSLKLAGCIPNRKKLSVELTSSSFGLVGSLLFLAGNTLGYLAQKEAAEPTDVTLRMIAVASCFTLSTALHTYLAGRAVCAKAPEEDVLTEVRIGDYSFNSDLSVDDGAYEVSTEDRRSSPNLLVKKGGSFLQAPPSSPVAGANPNFPGRDSPVPSEVAANPNCPCV